MSNGNIGQLLFVFVIIYFFFDMGKKLAYKEYENDGIPWILTILLFIFGIFYLNARDMTGYVLSLPMITYVFMKIFENSEKNIKRVFLGAMGSIAMEMVATGILGLGGAEALVSAGISFVMYAITA